LLEIEEWLANALFFGAKIEVKMFECYDELVQRLPKESLQKQAAAIRAQEANHLRISSDALLRIVSNEFLSKKAVFVGRENELTELVGSRAASFMKPLPDDLGELLDYCYFVETFYESSYSKLVPRIRIPEISTSLLQMVAESRAHAKAIKLIRENL